MKIFLAGNVTIQRERVLIRLKADRLYSYYYHGDDKEFNDEYQYRIKNLND